MSLHFEVDGERATIQTRPEYGRPVTFEVRRRKVKVGGGGYWTPPRAEQRYVVGLKGSDGDGFSTHLSFETACSRALSRARRYEQAYSKPRGVMAA